MQFNKAIPGFCLSFCLLLALPHVGTSQTKTFSEREPRYKLQPSDVLEVHYRYTPEFDQTVTVQPDGFVILQIVGDIHLQGLTLEEAKEAIVKKATERLKDPEVTIVLKEFVKPYFVVGGEVANPGRFEMHGSINALQAIAMAGGFKTASANHSQVILYRRVGPTLAKMEVLDLKTATKPNATTEPLADLRPDDMLFVPQNRVSKVERIVKWGNWGALFNPLAF